ncbi:SPX domain-containing protein [Cladochytrium replicatum]|nr:SPX domain-containing protein [Cladochytrium replicatum]
MKFSHSLKINAKPQWQHSYLHYAHLKKLIYKHERVVLDRSSPAPASRTSSPERTHITPALSSPALEISSDTTTDLCAEFASALDAELTKIAEFYGEEWSDVRSRLEQLGSEVMLVDTAVLIAEEGGSAVADEDYARGRVHLGVGDRMPPLRRNSGGSSLSDQGASGSAIGHVKRQLLQRELVDLYLDLNDLKEYIELNHTGFGKILKKYDKVTGFRMKRMYMDKLDTSDPFVRETRSQIADELNNAVRLFARVATDNDIGLAQHELQSCVRERVVWERNTVWKDMVEKERRTATARVVDKSEVVSTVGGAEKILGAGDAGWRGKLIGLTGAGVMFLAILYFQPMGVEEQSGCLAILVLASILWAAEIVPLFVTSLLIPMLVVLLRVLREEHSHRRLSASEAAKKIFSEMWSSVIMLLLGGFALAAALSKHNIAKGAATWILGKAGSRPSVVLLTNMLLSTFVSMWISNVAAPVLCFSLIQPILRNLDPRRSKYGPALVLGIAMASNVGGMASPISSPQNIVAISNMDPAPSWLEWFAVSIPVCIVIDLVIWAVILAMYPCNEDAPAPPQLFVQRSVVDEERGLPEGGVDEASRPLLVDFRRPSFSSGLTLLPISATRTKWISLTPVQIYITIISLLTIVLWCSSRALESVLGDMGVIALVPLLAFFGAPGVLTKDDFNSFPWNVVALAMGGIALGKSVQSSGLLAEVVARVGPGVAKLGSPIWTVAVVCAAVGVATSFVSHTVGALIILPVVYEIGKNLEDPRPNTLVLASALMCSGAMALPVSSFPNMNAISLEGPTGTPYLKIQDFLRIGILGTMVSWAIIVFGAYFLMDGIGIK